LEVKVVTDQVVSFSEESRLSARRRIPERETEPVWETMAKVSTIAGGFDAYVINRF
jgi:hypothetical protein